MTNNTPEYEQDARVAEAEAARSIKSEKYALWQDYSGNREARSAAKAKAVEATLKRVLAHHTKVKAAYKLAKQNYDTATRPVSQHIKEDLKFCRGRMYKSSMAASSVKLQASDRAEAKKLGVTAKSLRDARRAEKDKRRAWLAANPTTNHTAAITELTAKAGAALGRGDGELSDKYIAERAVRMEQVALGAPNTNTSRHRLHRSQIKAVAQSRGRQPVKPFDMSRRPGEAAIQSLTLRTPDDPDHDKQRELPQRHGQLLSIHIRPDNQIGVPRDRPIVLRLSACRHYEDSDRPPVVITSSYMTPATLDTPPVATLCMTQSAMRFVPSHGLGTRLDNTTIDLEMRVQPGLTGEQAGRAAGRVEQALMNVAAGADTLVQYQIAQERLVAARMALELCCEPRRWAAAAARYTYRGDNIRVEFVPWHPDDSQLPPGPVAAWRRLVSSDKCPPAHWPYPSSDTAARGPADVPWSAGRPVDMTSPTRSVHYTQSGYFRTGKDDGWTNHRGDVAARPDSTPWRGASTYRQGTLYITVHNDTLTT